MDYLAKTPSSGLVSIVLLFSFSDTPNKAGSPATCFLAHLTQPLTINFTFIPILQSTHRTFPTHHLSLSLCPNSLSQIERARFAAISISCELVGGLSRLDSTPPKYEGDCHYSEWQRIDQGRPWAPCPYVLPPPLSSPPVPLFSLSLCLCVCLTLHFIEPMSVEMWFWFLFVLSVISAGYRRGSAGINSPAKWVPDTLVLFLKNMNYIMYLCCCFVCWGFMVLIWKD